MSPTSEVCIYRTKSFCNIELNIQNTDEVMDRLPRELINNIVLCLERYPNQAQVPMIQQHYSVEERLKCPPFAPIYRYWKQAVEIVISRSLRINSDELSQFGAIITGHLANISRGCP